MPVPCHGDTNLIPSGSQLLLCTHKSPPVSTERERRATDEAEASNEALILIGANIGNLFSVGGYIILTFARSSPPLISEPTTARENTNNREQITKGRRCRVGQHTFCRTLSATLEGLEVAASSFTFALKWFAFATCSLAASA